MNKYTAFLIGSIAALLSFTSNAAYNSRYGRTHVKWVCNPYNNICHKIYRQERWHSPYNRYHYLGQKHLRKSHTVINTEPKHVYVAPPEMIEDSNIINVNLNHGTWGAYDFEGKLIHSGRVSGGKSYCPDINQSCKTVTGTFTIYEKRSSECKSKIFPVGKGGAPMPYCMFFHKGFALHGSNAVPNYNASHGCVRMPAADAQWLNQNFVIVGTTRVNITYEKWMPQEQELFSENETE